MGRRDATWRTRGEGEEPGPEHARADPHLDAAGGSGPFPRARGGTSRRGARPSSCRPSRFDLDEEREELVVLPAEEVVRHSHVREERVRDGAHEGRPRRRRAPSRVDGVPPIRQDDGKDRRERSRGAASVRPRGRRSRRRRRACTRPMRVADRKRAAQKGSSVFLYSVLSRRRRVLVVRCPLWRRGAPPPRSRSPSSSPRPAAAVPADLVLRNARVVNVLTGEIHNASVGVKGDRILGFSNCPAEAGRTVTIDLHGGLRPHRALGRAPPHRIHHDDAGPRSRSSRPSHGTAAAVTRTRTRSRT